MNDSNNFDKNDRKYSLAPTDDLFRFWRSKVKVTAGHRDGKASMLTLGVEVHLLVLFQLTVYYFCNNKVHINCP